MAATDRPRRHADPGPLESEFRPILPLPGLDRLGGGEPAGFNEEARAAFAEAAPDQAGRAAAPSRTTAADPASAYPPSGSADTSRGADEAFRPDGDGDVGEDGDAQDKLVLKKRPVRRLRRRHRRRGGDQGGSTENGSAASPDSAEVGDEFSERGAEFELDDGETASSFMADSELEVADDVPRQRPARSSRRKAAPLEPALTEPLPRTEITVCDATHHLPKPPANAREMIINVTAGAECRIAILHNGRLEELYLERQSEESHVGNIYKGRITNVEPSIQAAFVDFGLARNGFLHISDVQPRYFSSRAAEPEAVGKKVPRRDRPPIQKCFRRNDEVLVQVAKEGVGTKGPTLTTYLSIPGRFVVMMPGMNKLGVSRRIEDEEARQRMRELLGELTLPDGMGFILRTAGLDRTKRDLQGDMNYLSRLWKTVEERIASRPAPCELYRESDLVIRTIRDIYSTDFCRIVVDDYDTAVRAAEFLRIAMPRSAGEIVHYSRPEPIFHYFGTEDEIRQIHSRRVPLSSGGSIVIEATEAMVAIDVNSGKFRDLQDAEETAFRINLEAAEEIARQLRLRDLGGIVVCDFIDLRLEKHKRTVERALRDALKKHKERARILRMSKFGLIEMTRQRQRPSIDRSIFSDCGHCSGTGMVKNPESVTLEVMRLLQLLTHREEVQRITLHVYPPVASLVLNRQRAYLQRLEDLTGKAVTITPDPLSAPDEVRYDCEDDRGMPIKVTV